LLPNSGASLHRGVTQAKKELKPYTTCENTYVIGIFCKGALGQKSQTESWLVSLALGHEKKINPLYFRLRSTI